MESLIQYVSPPSPCGYLPDQMWSLEYEMVVDVSPREYLDRLRSNWRRFGHMMFHPQCRACRACRSLRVLTGSFRPNRSQRRAQRLNVSDVRLVIGEPAVTREKLNLYDKYHARQVTHKGWPEHPAKDAESYSGSFVDNPFPTEEWCYYLDDCLIGVGYVDDLHEGMSAIYFYYDPELRRRSLGTWNVLCLIGECLRRRIPHLYLGYYVPDCLSLSYKANFAPNEVLAEDGVWRAFRS